MHKTRGEVLFHLFVGANFEMTCLKWLKNLNFYRHHTDTHQTQVNASVRNNFFLLIYPKKVKCYQQMVKQ